MPSTPRFELVIFDCDGVLIDSEPIANRVLAECLTGIGLPTSAEDSLRDYKGHSWPVCLALFERKLGRPLPDSFAADFYRRMLGAYERELVAVPGIHDALERIPTLQCVASNGRRAIMKVTLAKVGLFERFAGRIFSAADVARPKPAPDLFLHAAARLGIEPARCAVIEDSPHGVSAAVAAGMTAFGYAGSESPGPLATAGARVFSAMADLPAALGFSC
ncbi:MAG TPA: HAD family hydrolase [Myxococcota bacterium]|nr:HAD family hydrolase [Myxococcota bacterium]